MSARHITVGVTARALIGIALASAAVARNAPDPLPAYSSLERETWVVLHSVSDEIGKFLVDGEHEYYVWDVALAELPNGQIRYLRLELQRDDGLYYIHTGSLSDWTDAVEVTDLDDANGGDWVEFADDYGRPDFVHPAAIGQGAIGGNGTTIEDPGAIDRGGCKGKNQTQCNGACGPLWSCGGAFGMCDCTNPTDPVSCGGTRSIECENATCPGVGGCGAFCHCG